jgi:mannose-1-phosphate guanylyltransferase
MLLDVYIFIMAGGSGERFWPLSRKQMPKHLLRLFSEKTLLEMTLDRVEGLVPAKNIFVITNEQQVASCLQEVPILSKSQVLAEPEKRDTAPATAYAAGIVKALNPDGVIILLPADHVIKNKEKFHDNLKDAVESARLTDSLITVGIKPTEPETGYGYIRLNKTLVKGSQGSVISEVNKFVEKPNLEKAQEYLDDGNYLWNGGVFVWKLSTYLKVVKKAQPELAKFVENFPAEKSEEYVKKNFPALPKISIDYAVLEKAEHIYCVHSEFDWDDVGAWSALDRQVNRDQHGNTVVGKSVMNDSRNNISFSSKRTIVLQGIDNLIVVETDDTILVCRRDQAQEIKKILGQLPPELL